MLLSIVIAREDRENLEIIRAAPRSSLIVSKRILSFPETPLVGKAHRIQAPLLSPRARSILHYDRLDRSGGILAAKSDLRPGTSPSFLRNMLDVYLQFPYRISQFLNRDQDSLNVLIKRFSE